MSAQRYTVRYFVGSRSDALMSVTPEYNRDIPGALKNAIDWGSRPCGTNFTPGLINAEGEVTEPSTQKFLRSFMAEFHGFIDRVLMVLPQEA